MMVIPQDVIERIRECYPFPYHSVMISLDKLRYIYDSMYHRYKFKVGESFYMSSQINHEDKGSIHSVYDELEFHLHEHDCYDILDYENMNDEKVFDDDCEKEIYESLTDEYIYDEHVWNSKQRSSDNIDLEILAMNLMTSFI